MDNLNFKWVLKFWKYSHYTAPLMNLLCLLVIIYAMTSKRKSATTKVILFLSWVSLTQSILSALIIARKDKSLGYIDSLAISAFIITEITCCYYLVLRSKVSQVQKRAMQMLIVTFYIFEVIHIIPVFFENRYDAFEGLIELPLVIIFTAIYYYNIIIKPPQQDLRHQPLFWALSGMALIAIVQIPCVIILDYIVANTKSGNYSSFYYTITCSAYCLLFICFLKAIQLDKKITNHDKDI